MNSATKVGLGLSVLLLSACATNSASKASDANLSKLRSFYVVRELQDDHGIDLLIASRLNKMGYQSDSGEPPKPAAPVDAIVTYQGHWTSDKGMYMIKLEIQIHDGASGAVLAKGEVSRPSWPRTSPEGMVEETLEVIFK